MHDNSPVLARYTSLKPDYGKHDHDKRAPFALPPETPREAGERIMGFHRQQLMDCKVPPKRIKEVFVRCKGNESTGDAVIRACKDQKVEQLCIGSRGLGRLQRPIAAALGLGSVGDHIAHNSKVPVTIGE